MKICEIKNQNLGIIKSYQKCLFQFGTPPWTGRENLENHWGVMTKIWNTVYKNINMVQMKEHYKISW